MQPVELSRHQAEPSQMVVDLYLDPALFWFAGHFDVQPLLPGVAQIDWAMHFAAQMIGNDLVFAGIDKVKFQLPLLPKKRVSLSLNWNESRGQLNFSYSLLDGDVSRIASQGTIKLCR